MVRYHRILSQNDPERLRRANGDIISGRNPVMRALDPLGFRFRKMLGQGGGGIVLLVDLLDQNGQADQWVVKVPVGKSSLEREASNMRSMVGARHIVQRKFIRSPDQSAPATRAKLNTDEPDCMYGMELLKHGSVDRLLKRVSSQNLKLKDDELWMIFHCLFRACVAMSYPGTWSGGLNPETDLIPLRDESIPQDVPIETALSLVHFDIDPDNVLIGDFESDPGSHTHEIVPIFKIADLGVARSAEELERMSTDLFDMLYSRRLGKVENHAPVMWQLLTRCCTLLPPNHGDIEFSPDGVNTVRGFTYGADLIFSRVADEYDETLRTTIMWCMMHDPAERPTLRQLEHLIVGNLGIYQNDGDKITEGRTSISDILATPPPPPTPSMVSTSSTMAGLARLAGEIPRSRLVRWSSSMGLPGEPRRRTGRVGDRIRVRAARDAFRAGHGLRNMAQRAGRSIRRVFRGAVRRVTGGNRQTQLGNATLQRPEEQQDGRGRASVEELQRAMASMGFYGAP
ncbi:hypothetical protein FJTKL_08812 [Diaporthe vaccinii]|uniref:Protein kinase domain-containing protein n=1 Tax=Diaporthe vaccinii TaxID=105482 RepID=A0ABR4EQL9_9PEZI